jgi:hypothetical protein
MQNAGLNHSKNTDEITAADKQALLKSLKGAKDNITKISNIWFGNHSNIQR